MLHSYTYKIITNSFGLDLAGGVGGEKTLHLLGCLVGIGPITV